MAGMNGGPFSNRQQLLSICHMVLHLTGLLCTVLRASSSCAAPHAQRHARLQKVG
jgi:hypothetical protein